MRPPDDPQPPERGRPTDFLEMLVEVVAANAALLGAHAMSDTAIEAVAVYAVAIWAALNVFPLLLAEADLLDQEAAWWRREAERLRRYLKDGEE